MLADHSASTVGCKNLVTVVRRAGLTLRAEGKCVARKTIGVTLHRWTMQGTYLRAVVRGELCRNLDGSAAGVPDEAARQYAQRLLDERAARQAAKACAAEDVGKPA